MQTQMIITTKELHQCLYGAHYPMSKRHIMEFVKARRASFGLVNELKQLPEGVYFGVLDIQEELLENTWEEEER